MGTTEDYIWIIKVNMNIVQGGFGVLFLYFSGCQQKGKHYSVIM